MMAVPMGPRDVARATGVSTDTLRHYERKGLLPSVTRTGSGYRRYSAATVERVLRVANGQASGCDLGGGRRVERSRQRLHLLGEPTGTASR